jgi:hypothetical protein
MVMSSLALLKIMKGMKEFINIKTVIFIMAAG